MNLSERIDAVVDAALDAGTITGTVILVNRAGEPAYIRAAGYADREAGKPVAVDTIFRLASVSKPIVATTALAQIDRGLMQLDDAVADYLPYFTPAMPDGSVPRITIRHLLTHTAGLSYNPTPSDRYPADQRVSTGLLNTDLGFEENFTRLAAVPLDYEPGTAWAYSLALDVLGAVVAAVHGGSLQEAVTHHVTGPLAMVDTAFSVTDSARLAVPYADARPVPLRMNDPQTVHDPDGNPLVFSPGRIFNPRAFQSGGAGMVGTAPDVLTLLETLRQGGGPVLSETMTKSALQNQIGDIPREPKDAGKRFGFVGAVLSDPVAAKTPQAAGTVSWGGIYGHSWFFDPENKLAAVMFSNNALEGCIGQYPDNIRNAIYG